MNAIQKIFELAKSNPQTVVLPEAQDPRIIAAACKAQTQGLAELVLIGDEDKTLALAVEHNCDLNDIQIINPRTSQQSTHYADLLFKKRKAKGMTSQQAEVLVRSPLTYAALMVFNHNAGGCVAGAVYTTADVVRAGLQIIGMRKDNDLVSSFFIMQHELPHQSFQGTAIYADCALVIDPDAAQLASIAIASADSAKNLLNIQPKVALLSFSTAGSAKHPHVEKVIQAGKRIAELRPDIPLMTEVQFDTAILPDVLKHKAPDIKLEAPANIMVFPELQSANIGYKIAQRIGGVTAIGPILQGLKSPINDLSRGCSVDDVVQLIAVTSVQAQT